MNIVDEYMKKKAIILLILMILVSVLAIILLSTKEPYISAMLFGIIFIMFSIIGRIKELSTITYVPLLIIGIITIIIPTLMLAQNYIGIDMKWKSLIQLLLLFFLNIMGLAIFIINFIKYIILKMNCSVIVKATITEIKEINDNNLILYNPILKYNYQNEEYIIETKIITNINDYKIGNTLKIKINPDDPKVHIYKNNGVLSTMFLGLLFIIITNPIIVIMIQTMIAK